MYPSEDTTKQSVEKCASVKASDPLTLNNCEDQKQGNKNEKIENCDKTPVNEEGSQNVEGLVKSGISEQLMFNFSVLNKKDSFAKIKPPVPKEIPVSQVSTSLESEVSSSDGTAFKVCMYEVCLLYM